MKYIPAPRDDHAISAPDEPQAARSRQFSARQQSLGIDAVP